MYCLLNKNVTTASYDLRRALHKCALAEVAIKNQYEMKLIKGNNNSTNDSD